MTLALDFPVRITGGRFSTSEQGSREAALSAVSMVCSVEQGALAMLDPELGLPARELRAGPVDPTTIEQAIEDQVPGVVVDVLEMPSRGAGWEELSVAVTVDE